MNTADPKQRLRDTLNQLYTHITGCVGILLELRNLSRDTGSPRVAESAAWVDAGLSLIEHAYHHCWRAFEEKRQEEICDGNE